MYDRQIEDNDTMKTDNTTAFANLQQNTRGSHSNKQPHWRIHTTTDDSGKEVTFNTQNSTPPRRNLISTNSTLQKLSTLPHKKGILQSTVFNNKYRSGQSAPYTTLNDSMHIDSGENQSNTELPPVKHKPTTAQYTFQIFIKAIQGSNQKTRVFQMIHTCYSIQAFKNCDPDTLILLL
jgi:hypothetical protein